MPNPQEDELHKIMLALHATVERAAGQMLDGDENAPKEWRNAFKKAEQELRQYAAKDYLSHFSYVDWEVGDDDQLRIGDYISCNFQDHNGQDTHTFEGKIVLHHGNNLPVVLYNIDPDDEENSGDYASLQGLFMDGYDFTRIKQLKKGQS